ncbi:DnaJ domain [Trinorchestia longiramus]|nr:DnaJ domain [Trinorchestia longiramus]
MLNQTVALIVLVSVAICLAAKDYYQVLGVERGVSTAQIKRAFKKLALKHHPDKSDDPKASEKFMEITTAYETLFNEDKRKAYDRMGHEAYVQSKKQGGTPEEEAAFTNFFRQSTASSPDHEGYFESFDKFFSGGFGGPGQGGMYFRTDGAPMFQSDEFLDLDDIIYNPFWNEDAGSHFGSGQSFFGGGHFQQHQQQRHQQQHSQARNRQRSKQEQFFHDGDGFFSMFDSDFGHFSSSSQGFRSGGASKKCVTTKYRNSDGHWVESTSCTIG